MLSLIVFSLPFGMDNAVVEGILIEYHLIAQRIKLFQVNIPYLNPQMAHNAKLAL